MAGNLLDQAAVFEQNAMSVALQPAKALGISLPPPPPGPAGILSNALRSASQKKFPSRTQLGAQAVGTTKTTNF